MRIGLCLLSLVLSLVLSCVPSAPALDDPQPEDAVVVVDSSCSAAGCLKAVADIGVFTRSDIEPLLFAGVTIDNGYRVLSVEYATAGRSSTATVTLPVDLGGDEPSDGFPVVVNAHGTIGLDDPCRLSGTISGTGLAGLFGARGAIGIAPDYPGLGTPGLHSYLDAHSEGASVLDAVRAALLVARHEGVKANGRSAVVGLSQGGHAVLSAAALHHSYAPELDIRAFAATAPANVYEEQWRAGVAVAGPHLSQFALLSWSWAHDSGVDDSGIWAPALAPNIDGLLMTRCEWSPSFTDEPLLGEAISDVPADVFSAAFLDAFARGSWTGDFAFMGERFATNRVIPFEQSAPMRIWQGTADVVVLPSMTQALVADLRAGGMEIDLTLVPAGTHIDTAFGFLAFPERATAQSVAWIKDQLGSP